MQQKKETTAQVATKRKPWLAALQTRAAKNGAYASAYSALMVALVVVVNLVVGALPSQYTSVDLTDQKLFSLSKESKQLVQSLGSDVNLYYLARTGQEDIAVQNLLEHYAGLSKHIQVEQKDPVVYPTFAVSYGAQGSATGSVVVDGNNGRTRVIDANELYEEAVDYTTYITTASFAGESKLTSAISYVTRDDLPVVYLLTGHDEMALTESYANMLADANLQTQALNLLTVDAVPSDAGTVLFNAPNKDLTDDELQKLSDYLAGGGSLTLVTNYGQYSAEGMPNLAQLLDSYGLAAQNGLILETDANYFLSGYPYYLLPNVETHEIVQPLSESYMIVPMAHGITVNRELSADIVSDALLTTTTQAFLKENASVAGEQPTDVAETDLQGTFAVAAVAQNAKDSSKIVWMASSGLLDDGMNEVVAGANGDFVLNALHWGIGNEAGVTLHAKSLASEQLLVPQAAGSLWSTLFAIVLPVGMLCFGVIIWARRRKR